MSYSVSGYHEYMEALSGPFFSSVFDEQSKTSGEALYDAHYDKVYQYFQFWIDRGVHPYRGALIYLLTFTDKLGDNPKHKSDKWVVMNFQNYLPIIKKIEQTYSLFKT